MANTITRIIKFPTSPMNLKTPFRPNAAKIKPINDPKIQNVYIMFSHPSKPDKYKTYMIRLMTKIRVEIQLNIFTDDTPVPKVGY
jgi:hypothetical protein